MSKRIVIGIAGASGVTYGIRMLECLKEIDFETHLILSEAAKTNIRIETAYQPDEVADMADFVYDHKNVAAAPASGSCQLLYGKPAGQSGGRFTQGKTQTGPGRQGNPLAPGAPGLDGQSCRYGCPHSAAGTFILSPAQEHSGHHRPNDW
jgi:hypothetical protein